MAHRLKWGCLHFGVVLMVVLPLLLLAVLLGPLHQETHLRIVSLLSDNAFVFKS